MHEYESTSTRTLCTTVLVYRISVYTVRPRSLVVQYIRKLVLNTVALYILLID